MPSFPTLDQQIDSKPLSPLTKKSNKSNSDGLENLPDLIKTKIRVSEDGCWIWCAYLNKAGYGVLGRSKGPRDNRSAKTYLAHRYIYLLFNGEIEPGKHLHHTCKVTACVNPAHLQPLTSYEHTYTDKANIGFQYASRDHCKNGHPFSPENTSFRSDGGRRCKTCVRAKGKAEYRKERVIRQEYVDYLNEGHTYGDAAEFFGVSISVIGKHVPPGTSPVGLSKQDRRKKKKIENE